MIAGYMTHIARGFYQRKCCAQQCYLECKDSGKRSNLESSWIWSRGFWKSYTRILQRGPESNIRWYVRLPRTIRVRDARFLRKCPAMLRECHARNSRWKCVISIVTRMVRGMLALQDVTFGLLLQYIRQPPFWRLHWFCVVFAITYQPE
jgi:hypothetical protein